MKIESSLVAKDEEFMKACREAAEIIRKGLAPALTIWQVAKKYGFDESEIASELGSWKKKKE